MQMHLVMAMMHMVNKHKVLVMRIKFMLTAQWGLVPIISQENIITKLLKKREQQMPIQNQLPYLV